jgi:hypothetical protein
MAEQEVDQEQLLVVRTALVEVEVPLLETLLEYLLLLGQLVVLEIIHICLVVVQVKQEI